VDAIELLESQHREVKSLFKMCEKASGDGRRQLFEKIADDLAVHAALEEKHFYPTTKSARTGDLLAQAVEEHLSVKRIIADMLEMDPAAAQFDAKLAVLTEQVEHHIEEEEGELFPKAKEMLSADELEDLGLVMEDFAEELAAGGSPRDAVPAETNEAARI
jgi:hemerythrin superfamily protein